jgi:hypothetical protein
MWNSNPRRWALLHSSRWADLAPFPGRYSGAPNWSESRVMLLRRVSFGDFVWWGQKSIFEVQTMHSKDRSWLVVLAKPKFEVLTGRPPFVTQKIPCTCISSNIYSLLRAIDGIAEEQSVGLEKKYLAVRHAFRELYKRTRTLCVSRMQQETRHVICNSSKGRIGLSLIFHADISQPST